MPWLPGLPHQPASPRPCTRHVILNAQRPGHIEGAVGAPFLLVILCQHVEGPSEPVSQPSRVRGLFWAQILSGPAAANLQRAQGRNKPAYTRPCS